MPAAKKKTDKERGTTASPDINRPQGHDVDRVFSKERVVKPATDRAVIQAENVKFVGDEKDKKRMYDRFLARSRRIDPTSLVDPDPSFRYRWVANDTRSVQEARAIGFEITRPKECDASPEFGHKDDTGSSYTLGSDLVLMQEPIDLYEMRLAEFDDMEKIRRGERTRTAVESINKTARDAGITSRGEEIAFDKSFEGEPITVQTQN